MKERFEIWFKWISNLGNLIKFGTYVFVAGTFVVTMIARHDTNVKMRFIKSNKSISKTDVDSIFKLRISPLRSQMQTMLDNQVILFDNQQVIKEGLISHMKMDKTPANTDLIINMLNSFKKDIILEIKKNNLYDQVVPTRQNINTLSEWKK